MAPPASNRRAWDSAHRTHAEPVELPQIVQRTLGDLAGKRVLHLQCANGEATAALAGLGAVVFGLHAAAPAVLPAAPARLLLYLAVLVSSVASILQCCGFVDGAELEVRLLAAAAGLQLLATRPAVQMYLNEAVFCWYQRLHASRLPGQA